MYRRQDRCRSNRNRKINYSLVVDFFIPDEVTRIRVLFTEEQGIVATVPRFSIRYPRPRSWQIWVASYFVLDDTAYHLDLMLGEARLIGFSKQ